MLSQSYLKSLSGTASVSFAGVGGYDQVKPATTSDVYLPTRRHESLRPDGSFPSYPKGGDGATTQPGPPLRPPLANAQPCSEASDPPLTAMDIVGIVA